RAAAAYALGSGIDRGALPTLLAALEAGNEARLRVAAAAALGASGETAVGAPALAWALFAHGDPNAPLRRASARGLARLAGGDAVFRRSGPVVGGLADARCASGPPRRLARWGPGPCALPARNRRGCTQRPRRDAGAGGRRARGVRRAWGPLAPGNSRGRQTHR